MNRVIKMIMDGDTLIDADIFYPPTLIQPGIEVTAMRYATPGRFHGAGAAPPSRQISCGRISDLNNLD